MLDSEFKKIIDNARDVLVGKVPDPKAQIEQITTAMIYKFMDYMDLENIDLGLEPQFFVEDYKQFSWSELMDSKLSGEARLDLYVQAITKLPQSPHLPPLFRNIFKGTFLPFRDSRTLNLFLKEIDRFDYKNSENLGNAFEYLLSILGSQGDAGQFRTPRHIIDFIVSAVDPQKEDTILDPACGTAGFLISAYKHIIKNNSQNYKTSEDSTIIAGTSAYDTVLDSTENYMGEMLTPYQKGQLLTNVTGYDISPDMVKLSLVNLYLHGFKQPKIFEYDTLSDDKRWDDDFDVILANPPFMSPKGGITPHKRFSIQANRAELLFVDYIAEHLKIRGRAGIIVPEGIIFQASNAYKNLRKNLIENWGLYAVVSLPSGVFQPYSGVKTSILFLDKNLAKQSPDILFIKITNDGFDLGAQRRKIDKNDLPDALQILKEWKLNKQILNEELALKVPKTKIAEDGDYNLTTERYKEAVDYSNVRWDMVELGEICDLYQPKTITSNEIIKNGRYKVFGANGVIGTYNKYNHENSEIAVTCRGATCGTVNMTIPKSWITGNAMVVNPLNDNILKPFLYHVLKNIGFESVISGAAQPQITKTNMKHLKIPLPPLEIQKEIVAEIEQYQKVIDGAKQVVESYKPQIEIDPEWEKVKLGDKNLFDIGSGGTPNTKFSEYWGDDINWATLVDLYPKDYVTIISSTQRKISELGLQKSSASLLPKQSILFSSRATIGRVGINLVPLATNQGFKNIIINDFKKVDVTFVAIIMRSMKDEIEQLGTGGTYKEVSKSAFSKINIPLPPLSVQQEIVSRIEEEQKYVDGCNKLIEIYEQKIKKRIEKVWGE